MRAQTKRWSDWWESLRRAARRRDFPNLIFAERWIKALAKAGLYPRWRGDDKGD